MTTTPPEASEGAANRNTKDSVFTCLFSDPEELIDLYRTLHPEDKTTQEEDLVDITYKSVLMNGEYNDLGFRVGNAVIILVEAQSTWSPNILPRMLIYLAETYKRYLSEQDISLHDQTKVKLPIPELYVVFTGDRKNCPAKLTLSHEFFDGRKVAIEVEVTVLYGDRSAEQSSSRDIVSQYVEFARTFDEQRKLYGLTTKTIEETIRICKERGVLVKFLEKRKIEIMKIMESNFEQELATKAMKRKERAEGKIEGEAIGIVKGKAEGKAEVAKNLIAMGQLNYDLIAQATGLTSAEVAQLATT